MTRVSKSFIEIDENSSRYRQRRLSDEACFVDEECWAKSAFHEFRSMSFSLSELNMSFNHWLVVSVRFSKALIPMAAVP